MEDGPYQLLLRVVVVVLQVLEGLYKAGKARAIGVSNYNEAHLQELVAAAEVKPMVNQVRRPAWAATEEGLFEGMSCIVTRPRQTSLSHWHQKGVQAPRLE